MPATRRLAGTLSLLALLCGCQPAAPAFTDADAAAVRGNIDDYVRAALAADWEAWGNTLAEDVVFMPPNQAPLVGRDAAVSYVRAFPRLTAFTATPAEVAGQGDAAWVRGTYSLTVALPDGTPMQESGSFLEVHRRQPDGTWRYTHSMWHSDSPAAPPAASPTQ
jgi:ketosteroid isomerase-like protein